MFKVIYTKTLNHSSDIDAMSWEFSSKEEAFALFNDQVQRLVDELKANPVLEGELSIHHHRAFIRIESIHHCIVVVDKMNAKVVI